MSLQGAACGEGLRRRNLSCIVHWGNWHESPRQPVKEELCGDVLRQRIQQEMEQPCFVPCPGKAAFKHSGYTGFDSFTRICQNYMTEWFFFNYCSPFIFTKQLHNHWICLTTQSIILFLTEIHLLGSANKLSLFPIGWHFQPLNNCRINKSHSFTNDPCSSTLSSFVLYSSSTGPELSNYERDIFYNQ